MASICLGLNVLTSNQAIVRTNNGLSLTRQFVSEILIKYSDWFLYKKHLKMSSAVWWPFA